MKRFWILDFRFSIRRAQHKKHFALALGVLLFAICPFAIAQPKKVPLIGYLSSGTPASEAARSAAIRVALREMGYVEGQNITVNYRYGQGKLDLAAKAASELVGLNADVIVIAGGEGWVRAAQNATKTIPIVMTGTGSGPVEEGLVASLARPGGNVTGVTNLTKELGGKRLELLKQTIPKLIYVAVLYNPTAPGTVREVKEDLPEAALTLGLTVRAFEIRPPHAFEQVFTALNQQRPDGLYITSGPQMGANRKRFAEFALKFRLPTTNPARQFVDVGGLMYYGADLAYSYRRVAVYIHRILNGARPAELPIEQPTKFEFVVNLKTAKQIALAIPPNVLARADKVIR